MNEFGDSLAVFGFGLATSIVAWLITLRLIRPKIQIAEQISRLDRDEKDPQTKYIYRVKIRNKRFRHALDVSLSCRLRIAEVFEDRKGNVSNYTVPTAIPHIVRFKKRTNRVIWLHFHKAEGLIRRLENTRPELAKQLVQGSFRLEELLALPQAKLTFLAKANDGLSNSPNVDIREFQSGCVAIGHYEIETTRINPKKLKGYEIDELTVKDGSSSQRGDETSDEGHDPSEDDST